MTKARLLSLLPLCLAAAACATGAAGDYPSLAPREVERAQGTFEPVASSAKPLDVPAVPVDLTGGLPARLAALVGQAGKAHAAFTGSVGTARRLVAAAGGEGSDSWAAAQVALADLDSARSEAAIALADLDMLHAAASVQAEDVAAIAEARSRVLALVGEEDAELESLRARIR